MKAQSYSYPLDPEWTVAEMTTVIDFFRAVEDAYEGGVQRQHLLKCYRQFQTVVGSKMREKQLGRQFASQSGYQFYPVVKQAMNSEQKILKMVGD
ncbi:UPF0223 family protein [Limosilactobacillus sp.]|uniref:UPF0223 family protein n=1 Tax=Limosilactobacillus sp. TaxID=2773925 RepID=UPI003F011698